MITPRRHASEIYLFIYFCIHTLIDGLKTLPVSNAQKMVAQPYCVCWKTLTGLFESYNAVFLPLRICVPEIESVWGGIGRRIFVFMFSGNALIIGQT